MKILILSEAYPSPGNLYAMGFVHSRALEYLRLGHELTVLSFAAQGAYEFEGVRVRTAADIRALPDAGSGFDIVLSHAPNVRNHLRFLNDFPALPLVFFLHGHEVLLTLRHYPAPFAFDRSLGERLGRLARAAYDPFKLLALRRFCQRQLAAGRRLGLVFVSEWMRRETVAASPWMARQRDLPTRVIPNAVNHVFLDGHYTAPQTPDADFVCIRPFDNPKYAIDQVAEWARQCPELSFHVFGKGRYFDINPPPPNLKVFKRFVAQAEIPALLDRYRACAMPTRLDSQGVMSCEMASYGAPLFTSDMDVTREVLGGFSNVRRLPVGGAVADELRRLPPPLPSDDPARRRFHGPRLAAEELAFAADIAQRPRADLLP
jgi:glycosyltransferase involved in cell wall biosynthesis